MTEYSSPLLGFSVGMVRVSLADMDRETRENYTVVIQAKDMGGQLGGLAGTTTVNITLSDVNDNSPVFDQSKQKHPRGSGRQQIVQPSLVDQ